MIFDLKNEYQIPKFKEYVNKLFSERAVVALTKPKLTSIRELATVICLNAKRSTRKVKK